MIPWIDKWKTTGNYYIAVCKKYLGAPCRPVRRFVTRKQHRFTAVQIKYRGFFSCLEPIDNALVRMELQFYRFDTGTVTL
jgi:peptide subunit release factor 1 (eRF1)